MAYLPTPMTNNSLTGEALEMFYAITVNRKGMRVLRASKPSNASGEVQYVWRMVSFYMSRNPQHHCMPICADFGIQAKFQERREITKRLDVVYNEIIDAQPKENQFGTRRWARAFGIS